METKGQGQGPPWGPGRAPPHTFHQGRKVCTAPGTGTRKLGPGDQKDNGHRLRDSCLGMRCAVLPFLNTEMCTAANTTWMQPVSYYVIKHLPSTDASCHCKGRELNPVGLLRAHETSIHETQQPALETPAAYHRLPLDILPHVKYPQQT